MHTVPPALLTELLHGPKVSLPYRDYLLFTPLEAASELGWTSPWGDFDPQSPNLFWPQDRTWCVASEIDLFCTLVAGSEALAEALLADPRHHLLIRPDRSYVNDTPRILSLTA
jgi:hypothetical protein